MKLINEKGKLFGLINVVDLCCLLIILLVAVGFGWKILGPQVQASVAPTAEMTTVFRIRGAYPYMLDELERNDIVGAAASIDVGILSNIELWYGQRFQVKLGDANNMDIKISWMKSAVNQRSEYDMGILDVSFTTWPDRVGYTPIND